MNQTFNINRFWLLIKTETRLNVRNYLTLFLIFVLLILFSGYISTFGGKQPFYAHTAYSFLNIIILVSPFIWLKNVYHRRKGVVYAMVPTSQLEKILSSVVQLAVLVPASLYLLMQLAFFIMRLTGVEVFAEETAISDFKFFIGSILIQAPVFLCAYWFRTRKVLKTLFLFFAVMSLITWLSRLIIFRYMENFSFEFDLKSVNELAVAAVLIFVCWLLSYLKLRRTQI